MEECACESRELLDFLGGDPAHLQECRCHDAPDLKITAHDGHTGGQKTFLVCETCILHLMWLPQHPVGWIESTSPLHKVPVEKHHLLHEVPQTSAV